jgi:hypothetical protein
MGAFVSHRNVFRMAGDINARFAEGDPITEMTALQREFSIFSRAHDLKASASVLGLAPDGKEERESWFRFLDSLKTLASSEAKLNGHDLIRETLRHNLEGEASPVFFQYHDGDSEPRVLVTVSTPLAFSPTSYLVVSVPTWPEGVAMRRAVQSRRAARAAAGAKEAKPAKKAATAKADKAAKAPSKKSGKGGKASR